MSTEKMRGRDITRSGGCEFPSYPQRLAHLLPEYRGVQTVVVEEMVMPSLFHRAALIEDQDAIHAPDEGEAV
jgi:hypothetical protein